MFTYGHRVPDDRDQPGGSQGRAFRRQLQGRAVAFLPTIFLVMLTILFISAYFFPGFALDKSQTENTLMRIAAGVLILIIWTAIAMANKETRNAQREFEEVLAGRALATRRRQEAAKGRDDLRPYDD